MKAQQFVTFALIAIIGIALIGCGGDDEPPPPETFTVTFNANGGSPTPAPQTVEKGKTATEPTGTEIPIKTNYTLDGWYKENALTTKWNFATDIVTANVELFAKWVLAETAFRDYNDQVMFTDSGTDYKADIKDARTGARDKTLEELGIVEQLQVNVTAAFNNGNGPAKGRFRTVFDTMMPPLGNVNITIENDVAYASYEVDSNKAVRFSFEYLSSVSDEDLQAAITAAVTEMRALIS